MTEIVFVRKGRFAQPAEEISLERLGAIEDHSMFRAQVDCPRNVKQLKRVHILLKKICDNHPGFVGPDELKRELKRRSGMYAEFVDADGVVVRELDSISPAVMAQARFDECWKRWVELILRGDPTRGFDPILWGIPDEQMQFEIARDL